MACDTRPELQTEKTELTSLDVEKSVLSHALQGLSTRPPLTTQETWTPHASPGSLDVDGATALKPQEKEHVEDSPSRSTTAIPSEDSGSETQLDVPAEDRRKSIQIVLEQSGKRGEYVFTSKDPVFQDALQSGIRQEAEKLLGNEKIKNKPRDLIFTQQFTTFDRQNSSAAHSPFRGFFTLFWIAMGFILTRVAAGNYRTKGSIFGDAEILHLMVDRDLFVMLTTDVAIAQEMTDQASPTAETLTATGIDNPNEGDLTRRVSSGPKYSTNLSKEKSEIASIGQAIEAGKPLDEEQIDAFRRVLNTEITILDEELRGKCTTTDNVYPNNLTMANFIEWTCLPTLVYDQEYPRQERVNWWYVAEKSVATLGVIWVMIIISQAYIYPVVVETVRQRDAGMSLEMRWKEFPWVVSDMLFPMLLEQLLSWYVIWECLLNVLAEVTRFGDRGFYGAWWNSVSFDQYARDWNRPVHNFLLRHVYHSSISFFHLSKMQATFFTFFLSAVVHEILMFCLFKKVRGYLFVFQLLQLPLAAFSKTKFMRGRDTLGNILFWFGMFIGPSVITSLYLIV
ncbi:sterol O-acyltransferase 1 [Pyrenophora tritici-repentis Pt-1C-BFP]|uniref:Sterol O-acyltransferase 1 n=1 Tax=Pyrenophora tritici-repentis (strain Pt-1C-BFP) TaxID=426418 RepID=B2VTV3_PYRTR|nr:sterol O-acyltransferase 1 [Pyrenophora tritici-repentis Pt-1C-BFP]EDU41436.1 sterol O-acyltransferase 1 [Pyrenophora tritici-repentis Pt-1C-BFP]